MMKYYSECQRGPFLLRIDFLHFFSLYDLFSMQEKLLKIFIRPSLCNVKVILLFSMNLSIKDLHLFPTCSHKMLRLFSCWSFVISPFQETKKFLHLQFVVDYSFFSCLLETCRKGFLVEDENEATTNTRYHDVVENVNVVIERQPLTNGDHLHDEKVMKYMHSKYISLVFFITDLRIMGFRFSTLSLFL